VTARSGTPRELLRELALFLPLYLAASVYVTWPLARVLPDHVAGSPVLLMDLYLVTWILAWGTHALGSAPSRLFDGNAFHPATNVIASSEHLLGNQPIFAPVYLATGNPILGHNVLVLSSFVLCAVFMHLLLRCWTGSRLAAVTGSFAFAFAPWRFDLGRSHLLQVQYLPLVALLVDRIFERGSIRTGLAAGVVIGVQVLCSFSLGYPAAVLAAVGVAAGVVDAFVRRRRLPAAALFAMGASAAGCILPIGLAYLAAARTGVVQRDPVAQGPTDGWLWSQMIAAVVGSWTLVLGVAGACAGLMQRGEPATRRRAVTMSVAALVSVGLAAGYGGLWNGRIAPYRWLAPLVPGLSYYRAPIRFALLASFALATLGGIGVGALARWHPRRLMPAAAPRLAAMAASVVLVTSRLASAPAVRPMPVAVPPHVPAVYGWIAQQGENEPVLELPIPASGSLNAAVSAARAMYFSTYHWHPLLNGYTGYTPPSYELIAAWARQMPSRHALEVLVKSTGVRWIIVHGAHGTAAYGSIGLVYRGRFPSGEGTEDHLYEVPDGLAARYAGWIADPRRTVDGVEAARVTRPVGALTGRLLGLARTNHALTVRFTLENHGREPWPTTPIDRARRVTLAGRWLDDRHGVAGTFTGVVPGDVGPGETLEFDQVVLAPKVPGTFTLEVELSQGAASAAMLRWEQTITVGG